MFSAISGLRISLAVGLLGVVLLGTLGITLGLIAGYFGGTVDALIMRVADVQLTFPAILIALLVDGVAKSVFGDRLDAMSTLFVLVIAIGLSFWVQYARTVRGSVMVEKNKDYVAAAQLIGLPAPVIMLRHVLPNVMGPVLVIATINLALAIITEATLSFLGAGMPDTMPSLGTLIRIGNNYLFSGEWWIVAFPGIALARPGPGHQHARRLAARRAQSEAAMTSNPSSPCATSRSRSSPVAHAARDRRRLLRHRPGEVLGVVGKSGAGKSVTGSAVIGLIDPPGRIAGGEIHLSGKRIDNLPPEGMRRIRGKRIGMIFQDPLTSLNPLYRIGDQLIETIRTHTESVRVRGAQARHRTAGRGRHSRAGEAHRRLSARIVRRHAPARRDRAGDLRRAGTHHRRRADDRARRLGAGADHHAAQAPRRDHGTAIMLVTHDMGVIAETCRPRRGDVFGPDRGDRAGAGCRAEPAPSLCQGPDGRDPDAGGRDERLVQIPARCRACRPSRRAAPSIRAVPMCSTAAAG